MPEQQQYDNELSGALFPNDKGGNPSRPDMRGNCQIEGKTYRISAWTKTAQRSGQRYLSLAFTLDEAVEQQQPLEDNLPF